MPQPVITFLRYSLILKAAMADCLDNPKPEAVHRLRSSNRRLEAVLELLTPAADLPALPKRSSAFRRSVRKIRRIAGDVRDLDVHRELLRAYQTTSGATELETQLEASRKKKVKRMRRQISADEDEIRHALDRLEMIFGGIADLSLSGGRLIYVARSWLAPAVRGLDPHEDDDLHSIRKACKTARYIAEIGSGESRTAAKFAKRMEDVQQTTGAWHDYLLLLDRAQSRLPSGSPVIKKLYAKAGVLRRQAESKAAHLLKA
ncbi:CHAD domain-containing protein [Tunturibacter empetritectus]|uniref:CHAD domain-containing protein n=1 Tax=Tunturiibacter lichenicola TaxID=2051959 RepID=A0A7W8J443_9BACT|nr:CHAD domain-containing protein [Edaphobacter lichenicola]MBB5342221.1 CHAD domain-containing protein [Edaphobacter lichenicola]